MINEEWGGGEQGLRKEDEGREKGTQKRKIEKSGKWKIKKREWKKIAATKVRRNLAPSCRSLFLGQSIAVTIDWGIGDRATQKLFLTIEQPEENTRGLYEFT